MTTFEEIRNKGYEGQRQLFLEAKLLGWPGTEPSVLGTYMADKALIQVKNFLDCHKEDWFKLQGGK